MVPIGPPEGQSYLCFVAELTARAVIIFSHILIQGSVVMWSVW